MTVSELLLEIATRLGEGYQDYGDRIKSAFKKAVIELVNSGIFSQHDYPVMIYLNEYVKPSSPSTLSVLPIEDLLAVGLEFIRLHDLKYYKDDGNNGYLEPITCNLLSYGEYQAYQYNPALLPSTNKVAYMLNNRGDIGINIALSGVDKLEYTFIVWADAWLRNDVSGGTDYGAYVIDSYWSLQFRESVIDRALEILREEIARA